MAKGPGYDTNLWPRICTHDSNVGSRCWRPEATTMTIWDNNAWPPKPTPITVVEAGGAEPTTIALTQPTTVTFGGGWWSCGGFDTDMPPSWTIPPAAPPEAGPQPTVFTFGDGYKPTTLHLGQGDGERFTRAISPFPSQLNNPESNDLKFFVLQTSSSSPPLPVFFHWPMGRIEPSQDSDDDGGSDDNGPKDNCIHIWFIKVCEQTLPPYEDPPSNNSH